MSGKRIDPLFIVGDARSGTTYLTNLLVQREEIGIAPESNFVVNLLKSLGDGAIGDDESLARVIDSLYREAKFQDWGIDRAKLSSHLASRLPLSFADVVRAVLIFYCDGEFPGCKVYGVKKGGGYIRHASALVNHFPRAKFIHIVRDGRAVFNSQKQAIHTRKQRPFETNAQRAATRWSEIVRTFDEFAKQHPANAMEVLYEDLIADQAATLQPVLAFLEVGGGATSNATATDAYVPERQKYLHPNVGKPPIKSRIDGWKRELAAREIKIFEKVAGRELKRKSYALEYDDKNSASVFLYNAGRLLRRFAPKVR